MRGLSAHGCRRFGFLSSVIGQSTLEYALVVCVCLAICTCFALLVTAGKEGLFTAAAESNASHSFSQGLINLLCDVLGY